MTDEHQKLETLGQQLGEVRRSIAPKKSRTSHLVDKHRMLNLAVTIIGSIVAGVIIGALMGLVLDRWLGTSPWLLVIMAMFGTVAGFTTAIRIANEATNRSAQSADEQ